MFNALLAKSFNSQQRKVSSTNKSSFKRTINWDKYNASPQAQNRCLGCLRFQGINRLFLLLFETIIDRKSSKRYFLLTEEIKDYNVMIYGRNFFV